jgi:hypothetical protein
MTPCARSRRCWGRGTLSPEAARITAPMSDPDRVTDLLITLREAGIHLTEMSVQKPTLDEVFLTITGRPADAAATDSAVCRRRLRGGPRMSAIAPTRTDRRPSPRHPSAGSPTARACARPSRTR